MFSAYVDKVGMPWVKQGHPSIHSVPCPSIECQVSTYSVHTYRYSNGRSCEESWTGPVDVDSSCRHRTKGLLRYWLRTFVSKGVYPQFTQETPVTTTKQDRAGQGRAWPGPRAGVACGRSLLSCMHVFEFARRINKALAGETFFCFFAFACREKLV